MVKGSSIEGSGLGKGKTLFFITVFSVGIALVLLGVLLGSISGVIYEPDRGNEDDYDSYETGTRWLNFFARLSFSSGLVFVAVASFLTAVIGKGLHPTVRAGLGVAGGLIIGLNQVIIL